jgi:diguanylate cyclase (GGDEF)-like protein
MRQIPDVHSEAASRRPTRWVAAAIAIAPGIVALARVTRSPMSDITMLASTAVAAGGFLRASRSPELRGSLVLLGFSATAWVAGVGSWLMVESWSPSGSGLNPGSGLLMLTGSALVLAGALRLPGAPTTLGGRVRLALDCLLVATSVTFVAWEPFVEPAMAASHRSVFSELATLSLPVADIVILAAIGAVMWRSIGGRVLLGLLAASAAVRTGADVRFAYYALGGFTSRSDTLIDVGWAVSYGLLALAAVASGGRDLPGRRQARRTGGRHLQLLMYLPVGAALVTAAGIGIVERRMHGAQLTVLLLIAGLLVARQWIMLSENRQLLQRVAFQGEHDDLTGLLNRTGLLRRLSKVVADGRPVRVHLIDIDRFKDVNETLGHPVGDSLLIAIGNRLETSEQGLEVARLGGDEFAVIDDRHDGTGVAERLLAAIGEPYTAAGRAIHLDASLGVAGHDAVVRGCEPADPDRIAVDLLRDADSAMHAAKTAGGGMRVFEDELRREMLDRVALGHEFRDALLRDELTLAYQPIVDMATGGVSHVEALARWNHPTRGFVPPGVFIPLAESSGMMPLLGRWILHTACAQAAEWLREGFDIGVAVNVSAQQLSEAGIMRDVSEALRSTGLKPRQLILELTESVFVDDSEAGWQPLEALRAMGVRIAIDDFGTGYSALAYLRRLPVDVLKLDRRFITDLDSADIAVVAAILAMAHALGLHTVAEGIETAEQLAHLRRLRCEFGQGYHLARPMAAEDVPGHLREPLPRAA